MKTHKFKIPAAGFSLIELLVVIAVIALLMTVVVPGLMVAKERARRVVCLSNIHQFVIGLQVYAEQNQYQLPATGLASTFELLFQNYDRMAESIGSEKSMFCPSLKKPFKKNISAAAGGSFCGGESDYNRDYMFIGYNYLGGQQNAPWPLVQPATRQWESALDSSCKITMPIVTELNVWSVSHDKTVAPHGNRGPYRLGDDYMNSGLGGITSGQLGASGGNLGYIDGSGGWKKIDETNIYRVSVDGQDAGWFSTW